MTSAIKKFDFDQYPDNAATSVDEGFIIKVSNNFADNGGPAKYQGVSWKYILFRPRIAGVCRSLTFLLVKFKVENVVVFDGNPNGNFFPSNFNDAALFTEYPELSGNVICSLNFKPKVLTSQAGSEVVLSDALRWTVLKRADGNKYVQISFPIRGSSITIYPCEHYICKLGGMTRRNESFYDWLFSLSVSGAQTTLSRDGDYNFYESLISPSQSLSARMKEIFPDSWVTP